MAITAKQLKQQLRQERHRMTWADKRSQIYEAALKQANEDARRHADEEAEDARKEDIFSRVREMEQQTSDMIKRHRGDPCVTTPPRTTSGAESGSCHSLPTCVVCYELAPCVVLLPCLHAVVCKRCVRHILCINLCEEKPSLCEDKQPRCPICCTILATNPSFVEPFY
jgi:hypothetical protein